MADQFQHYLSPFSWRYGSKEMRVIFSERHKYEIWRQIWVALAEVQSEVGLVSKKELADLKKFQNEIDIDRILEIEEKTRHDVVAGIREFAEKAKIGGGKIHLGATSMDIVDNTDVVRMKEGLELIEKQLDSIITLFAAKAKEYADLACMGYTHLQPAEPTTVGYRIAGYLQDLLVDREYLQFVKKELKAKGMKGAVGTRASYMDILEGTKLSAEQLDKKVLDKFGLDSVTISTQVYPRKFDYLILSLLASIASSLSKFAADVRILSTPGIGEWAEPFGKSQVGSSAMPFKKNPMNSEKVCSLARYVGQLPAVALENASLSHLERTLDDSANKRVIIAEGFLAVDEILKTSLKVISALVVNKTRIEFNLNQYGPFAATERIIIAAVKEGADRQAMHELMREISMKAWEGVQSGQPNQMVDLLGKNKELSKYCTQKELVELLKMDKHVGDAHKRVKQLCDKL